MELHLLKCAVVLGHDHIELNRVRALWDGYQELSSEDKQILCDVGVVNEHITPACRDVNACAATKNIGVLVLKLQRLSSILTSANGLLAQAQSDANCLNSRGVLLATHINLTTPTDFTYVSGDCMFDTVKYVTVLPQPTKDPCLHAP